MTLREELASIDEYLDIEMIRFGPSLIVDKDVKGRITIISNSPITVGDAVFRRYRTRTVSPSRKPRAAADGILSGHSPLLIELLSFVPRLGGRIARKARGTGET